MQSAPVPAAAELPPLQREQHAGSQPPTTHVLVAIPRTTTHIIDYIPGPQNYSNHEFWGAMTQVRPHAGSGLERAVSTVTPRYHREPKIATSQKRQTLTSHIDIVPHGTTMARTALRAPAISQVCNSSLPCIFLLLTSCKAELVSFHNEHFGQASIDHFSTNFLPRHDTRHVEQPSHHHQEEEEVCEDYEQEDDGLGYYEDGVKRTLTDEQIAMFRHSELEALRRSQEAGDSKPTIPHATATAIEASSVTESHPTEAAEPGELSPEDDVASEAATAAGKRKKRRRGKARAEPEKPDLRKRTWDLVDTGLASLDYGDEPHDSSSISRLIRRRHISYDD